MNKDELKQYRERIGLNQGELSKALGVANNTVSRWELGQRSIPEFLPLALETIERRLSTVGSIDNKSTVGSSESSKAQSAPVSNVESVRRRLKENAPVVASNPADVSKRLKEASGKVWKNSVLDIVQSSSDNEYVLTTAAAGELLNLSPRSVRENAEKGLLHGKQGKQSHWFFRRSDVDEYKARRGQE